MDNHFDVVVVGGGQSGLAMGYYLRRSKLTYVILDSHNEAGGAWTNAWDSLRLFSPAQWSSLPGLLMIGGSEYYPTKDVVIEYLRSYEAKYGLNIERPVVVKQCRKSNGEFELETSRGQYYAKALVSATGSFGNPFIPEIQGLSAFRGEILHSSNYRTPEVFTGKRVAIVGEGNSGAQIIAEVSTVTETLWATQKEPRFLPDHVDGRFLFDVATQMFEAQKQGKEYRTPSLGDIVMVDAVKEARERNVLKDFCHIDHFTSSSVVLTDRQEVPVDVVIFCTGFKPVLKHLEPMIYPMYGGRLQTIGTKSADIDGLWLVGYGNWTGFASATLIGVGRSAKVTVDQIVQYIGSAVVDSRSEL